MTSNDILTTEIPVHLVLPRTPRIELTQFQGFKRYPPKPANASKSFGMGFEPGEFYTVEIPAQLDCNAYIVPAVTEGIHRSPYERTFNNFWSVARQVLVAFNVTIQTQGGVNRSIKSFDLVVTVVKTPNELRHSLKVELLQTQGALTKSDLQKFGKREGTQSDYPCEANALGMTMGGVREKITARWRPMPSTLSKPDIRRFRVEISVERIA
jgi:hypothetical protein